MTTAGSMFTTPSRTTGRPSSLHELALLCGLETSFTDGCSIHRQASQPAIIATLQALAVKREVLTVLAGSLESHPNRRSQDLADWVRRHPLADTRASGLRVNGGCRAR